MWQKLQNVDRRIIYVLMMVVCVYALLNPMGLPISINETTRMAYDKLQALEPGDIVWLGYEFSAGGVPELVPAIKATAKLAFEQGAKIVSGTMWLEGQNLGGAALREMADKQGKVYGVDYVQIGYKPGGQVFLERAVDDLWDAAVGIDENGTDLAQLPLMAEVKSMADIDLIFIYCTGNPGDKEYVKIVGDRLNVPICSSVVSVSVPESMPFVRSGQLAGLLMGMRGAAEFEILAKIPGNAVSGMDAQSLSHVLIIVFILIGNLAYIFGGKKGGRV
jgi:hypothetical protein